MNTVEGEVADLEIAVGVDEKVVGLEVAMHHVGRVQVFQAGCVETGRVRMTGGGREARAGDKHQTGGIS